MEIVWSKVVAIRFNYVGSALLVTSVVTEHGAVIETDIPYEEAVEKLRSIEGVAEIERRKAQVPPNDHPAAIRAWYAAAAEGALARVTKERDEAIRERDEVRKFNEGLAEELGWEKGIVKNLLAELRVARDASAHTHADCLTEATEDDLLDLLRKLADGGGRRTGELKRRGWLATVVTETGRQVLAKLDDVRTIQVPNIGTVTCPKCGSSKLVKAGEEITPCPCWTEPAMELVRKLREELLREAGWSPGKDECNAALVKHRDYDKAKAALLEGKA